MKILRTFWIILTLAFMHVAANPLMAQETEEEGKSWVLNYIFTVLFIALGMLVVGYGTNREVEEQRTKERREHKEKEEREKKHAAGGH